MVEQHPGCSACDLVPGGDGLCISRKVVGSSSKNLHTSRSKGSQCIQTIGAVDIMFTSSFLSYTTFILIQRLHEAT